MDKDGMYEISVATSFTECFFAGLSALPLDLSAVLGFEGAAAVGLSALPRETAVPLSPAGFAALLGPNGSCLCFPAIAFARASMTRWVRQH